MINFLFLKIKSKNLILDDGEIYSPIVALKTILNRINDENIFIITVDTPLVTLETINSLIDKSEEFDITVAQTEKKHIIYVVFLISRAYIY